MAVRDKNVYDREKRVLLTAKGEKKAHQIAAKLDEALDTPVKFSHLMRASLVLIQSAEKEIIAQAKRADLTRPRNDHRVMQGFDRELAAMLLKAFKKTPPLR